MGLFRKKKDHLENGELPFGWYTHHLEEIKKWETPLPEYAIASKTGTPTEQIQTLQKMIEHYEAFRTFSYSNGECWKKYFSDMWEHCHNSKNPDFDYIEPYQEQLNELLSVQGVPLCS